MQALQTATIGAARAMQAKARAGSLDVGKQADVLIDDGNPLKQIRDLRRRPACSHPHARPKAR
jgi:imidazolonepropionase-like amidohydrolase